MSTNQIFFPFAVVFENLALHHMKFNLLRAALPLFLAVLTFSAHSQAKWNWPEDAELLDQAKEKQAYYNIQTQLDDWNGAFSTLSWLYQNNPNLNPSIYIDGAKILGEILKTEEDENRVAVLEDSLLWMFDQRVKHFGDEGKVVDRKAYEAFKRFYRKRSKYSLLEELYEQNYALNGNNMSDFNLIPYMTLAKFYYEWKPEEMTPEKVLEIHDRVSSAIAYKIEKGGNKAKLKKDQDKADAFLSSLEGILSCEFIEEKLVPKLEADPSDINTAKKIFNYSLQAKCSDRPYFTQAGEVVYVEKPTFKLAKALGDKYQGSEDFAKASEYYLKASELATDKEEEYDVYMGLATASGKLGDKGKARSYAREALAVRPGAPEAYNLMGNLYFTSYDNCKAGESKVMDRAVFLAAYEMYKLAGNTAQMNASKEQFPSIEEIFNEGYEEGQEVTLGCWINTTVALQRRD